MELRGCLEKNLDALLTSCVVSGSRGTGAVSRIKVRPVKIKGTLQFQATEYTGTRVMHRNYAKEEMIAYLEDKLVSSFKQCQMVHRETVTTILVSKKGRVTISSKGNRKLPEKNGFTGEAAAALLEHNKTKKYILPEGVPVPFLVSLGVMTKEGKVVKAKYDKFRQINRFLEFIEDVSGELPADREFTILDFGCGKSYLTFAVYYYFNILHSYRAKIIGLDLKEDVINQCGRLAESLGYDRLCFLKGDIAQYGGVSRVDMVMTLHACDTATDYALYKAVCWNAKVILSVPCCQHEVNRQISNELLAPVLKYGILKERMSALITDGIRAGLLEECGYKTDILEFIDMEHTPKNLLIRAVKTERKQNLQSLHTLIKECGISQTLNNLMQQK